MRGVASPTPRQMRVRWSETPGWPTRGVRPAKRDGGNAMRPVRFVALSEDGQALVLADEVGRLLALPIDERIASALHAEPGAAPLAVVPTAADPMPSLSPRDIQ